MLYKFKSVLLVSFLLVLTLNTPSVAQKTKSETTIKVKVKNRTYVGTPLQWDGRDMDLLRRDGRWSVLPVTSKDDFDVIAGNFSVMSREKMILKLKKEFGKRYSVSSTSSFLVVHPHGNYQKYAKPFVDLNKKFSTYFSKRGQPLEEARFPMVAVVLNTRGEFDRMLKANVKEAPNWVGYYSSTSNRIITYDRTKVESEGFFKSNTLIHEAAHQVAYNRGVHNRFGSRSSWIVEGLACMFEAEGVHNRHINSQRKDRVNSGRLWEIQSAIKNGSAKGTLKYIVRDDKLFRSRMDLAYAYAWGLTFYLAETQPRAYVKFLTDDAKRPNFSAYGSNERLELFAEAFGSDFDNLESRMFKFLQKQKIKIPAGYTLR